MLIVAGWLRVAAEDRQAYLTGRCTSVVEAARRSPGCREFSISADLVEPELIMIHERWDTEEDLLAFRGTGPSDDEQDQILDAHVRRYEISGEGPA